MPRAYNDFLVEWCSADPNRLIPVAAMPFWDIGECVKEVERAVTIGHKAILAASKPQDFGHPSVASPHWNPFWAAVQDAASCGLRRESLRRSPGRRDREGSSWHGRQAVRDPMSTGSIDEGGLKAA
jgi:hypothetical protein